jgi:mRNA interferase MazF
MTSRLREGPRGGASRISPGGVRRREVWWARVDKRRPVVLVSRDEAYGVRALVIVAPASTTVRNYPVEVRIGRREGLERSCVVNCD